MLLRRMKFGRVLILFVVGFASIAALVIWRVKRSPGTAELPAARDYKALPPAFRRAVDDARAAAAESKNFTEATRRLARLYQANRLFNEAEACYAALLKKNGELSPPDHYYVSLLAQEQGDLPRAQRELEIVLQKESHYIPARLALAEILFKTGQPEEADRQARAALDDDAGNPAALIQRARVALQRKDDEGAIALLQSLLARHPDSRAGAALLAQILGRRGEKERAGALAQLSGKGRDAVPADPWAEALWADCFDPQRLEIRFEELSNSGQIEEAVPLLKRVEELEPGSWIPALLHGWLAARAKLPRDAVQHYRDALEKGGDPERIVPLLVMAVSDVPAADDVLALVASQQARKPDSVPILIAYADLVTRRGDNKRARELLTQVLEKEPYLYLPNMNLAQILWSSGQRDEAVKCLSRVAKVFASDVASRGLLGQYYLEKNDPAAAVSPLEQALDQTEKTSAAHTQISQMLDTAYLQLGSTAVETQSWEAALKYFDKATHMAPSDLRGYAGLANACMQLQKLEPAAAALEMMTTLEPENPTVYLSLGDVRYQLADRERAQSNWRRAAQLVAPGDTELRAEIDVRLSGHITAETFK